MEVRDTDKLTYLIHFPLVTNFQTLPPTRLIFGQFQLIIEALFEVPGFRDRNDIALR